jgi:prophage regulatory protein
MVMRLLNVKDISDLTTLSGSTIYRLIDEGEFPQPFKIKGRNVWGNEQVEQWMKNVIKENEHDTV